MASPEAAVQQWGPRRWVLPTLVIAVAAAVTWLLLDASSENRVVAATLAVVALVVALVVIRVRVRLRLTDTGLEVRSVASSHTWAWSEVRSVTTPQRGRFGRRGASLEIEVGAADADRADWELLVFGSTDLGADPAAVGRAITRTWRAHLPAE